MILRTFSIFIAAIFLIIHDNSAQEREYIVTNNNDTIYGKVSRRIQIWTTSETKFILKDENGNKSSVNPAEVKIIRSFNGVDGDSFIATAYDQWFAKRIIDGRIKVYLSLDTALFYTSKDNSGLRYTEFGGFTSKKKAHALIRPLIEDNPVILKEFDSLKGSEANILYIIKKYNALENRLPVLYKF